MEEQEYESCTHAYKVTSMEFKNNFQSLWANVVGAGSLDVKY